MDPKNKPKAAINRAFHIGPLARNVKIVRPKIIKVKYSGGPNSKATAERGGAISIKQTILKVPAIKDPNAAIPKAGPAIPLRAIW